MEILDRIDGPASGGGDEDADTLEELLNSSIVPNGEGDDKDEARLDTEHDIGLVQTEQ